MQLERIDSLHARGILATLLLVGGLALTGCGGVTESQPNPPAVGGSVGNGSGAGTTRAVRGSAAGTAAAGDGDTQAPGTTETIAVSSGGAASTSATTCPCSRRPGANNSFKCAMGVGQSLTQEVGPAGGVVVLHAQQGQASGVDFKIDVPPNAFAQNVQLEITETPDAPPADLVDYSPIYRVAPSDVASQVPLKLTLPYGGNDGEIPRTLAIYVAADSSGPFERVGDSYVNAGFLQGSTQRLGVFLAGAPRSAAQSACP